MTTNADTVKNYKAVDEVNGGVKNGADVVLRKRKESLARRQQSLMRQDSCGVDLIDRQVARPLTKYAAIWNQNPISIIQGGPPCRYFH